MRYFDNGAFITFDVIDSRKMETLERLDRGCLILRTAKPPREYVLVQVLEEPKRIPGQGTLQELTRETLERKQIKACLESMRAFAAEQPDPSEMEADALGIAQEESASTELMGEHEHSLITALNGWLNERYEEEGILDLIPMIQLEYGYSPVLPHRGNDIPCEVLKKEDGSYTVVIDREHGAFLNVHAEVLKVMRARFMHKRGEYDKMMHALPYYERQRVIVQYFNGMWLDVEALRSRAGGTA